MTTGSDKTGLDTAEIDGGWGDESEEIPAAKPVAPPAPAAKPAAAVQKPLPPIAPKPVKPRALKPPKPEGTPGEAGGGEDDIEYDAEVISRDSMPTFQHPNPLEFDQVPPSEKRVPRPPPLPQIPKRPKRR